MAEPINRSGPEHLFAVLKKGARKNRRRVNREPPGELEAGLADESETRRPKMLFLADELRKEVAFPLKTGEIRAAIEEGRK